MKQLAISLLSQIFLISISFANEFNTQISPPSPNASSLAMYCDYPVSHYTGIPNINLPLYQIVIGDFTLPISVSYHASGIKIGQEASWIGLGWTLNAGGSISRNVRCYDDFNLYSSGTDWGLNMDIKGGYMEAPIQPHRIKEYNDEYVVGSSDGGNCGITYNLVYDSQPDIYYLNIPSVTGAFTFSQDRNAYFFNHDQKIKITYSVNRTSYTVELTAYTSDGVKYTFSNFETVSNYCGNGDLNKINTTGTPVMDTPLEYIYLPNRSGKYISNWYLTKIETPNKREIIFEYVDENYLSPTYESCINKIFLPNQCNQSRPPQTDYSISKSLHETKRLSKISWDEGYIDFMASERQDMKSENKGRLDPQKIEMIKIYDKQNNLFKSYLFSYDYFNNDYTGSYNYLYKRLKLNEINEIDPSGNRKTLTYKFSYFDGELPAKNSNNTDFWGYYNGKNFGAVYYPMKYSDHDFRSFGANLTGADKRSSLNHTRIWTLNKIEYSTGGSTIFDYELNTYSIGSFELKYNNSATEKYNIGDIGFGAGLRIKSITSNDMVKQYEYWTGNMIVFPNNFFVTENTSTCCYPNYFARASNSNKSLSAVKSGNSIGYTDVNEKTILKGTSYSTEYRFYNEPEIPDDSPYIPNTPNFSNGLIQNIVYRNSTGTAVKQIQNIYNAIPLKTINSFFFTSSENISHQCDFDIEWFQKTRQETTEYFNGKELISSETYKYNQHNYMISEIEKFNSKNIKSTFKIKYPVDFSDDISKGMTIKNMIGIPIEKYAITSNTISNASKIQYFDTLNTFLPKKYYSVLKKSNIEENQLQENYRLMKRIDRYSDKGLPISTYENSTSLNSIYLWSYYCQHPIALIENITYSQLEKILGSAYISNLSNNPNPSDNDLAPINNLRYNRNYPNIQVTTYKYIPLVGLSKKTDARGISTYYKYDEFNRLKGVSDDKNQWLNYYNYHYYNQ